MREFGQKRERLTNEALKGLFKSSFELTNQAIRLARYYIKSGHEVSLDRLLVEIRNNPQPDYVDDLKQAEKEDEENS